MRKINRIIVHCSASSWGDANEINRWHLGRGWAGIGYHYVILNGYRDSDGPYIADDDGRVESGRPVEKQGAHCSGCNHDSIGICLIGRHMFTAPQLYTALPALLWDQLQLHGLSINNIFGHREFNRHKTCPNIDPALIRGNILSGQVVRMIQANFKQG